MTSTSIAPAEAIMADMVASGGNPGELTPDQARELRTMLDGSLWLFARLICGFKDLHKPLHGPICTLLERWGEPGFRRIVVQIPREHFKTSLCTIANGLWQVSREPDQPVIIFNEREENTKKWVRGMQNIIIANPLYRVLYPDRMPPLADSGLPAKKWSWNDQGFDLMGKSYGTVERTISGTGITAATAGGHWPKRINDDIIGLGSRGSPAVMSYAWEWVKAAFDLERPAHGGMDLFVCTPWEYGDVYHKLLTEFPYEDVSGEGYRLHRRSALEQGKSIFPQKLPTKKLRHMAASDPYTFACMYMCLPRATRDVTFQLDWFRHGNVIDDEKEPYFLIDTDDYDPEINEADDGSYPPRRVPLAWMDKGLFFDPAPTEAADRKRESGSRNGLVMEGIDPWGRRYVLEAKGAVADPYDIVNVIFGMLKRWGCAKVYVEDVAFTKVYKHVISREAALAKLNVICIPCPPGKVDKDTRIQEKIPSIRGGLYYLNTAETHVLIEESMVYAPGPTQAPKDILDAWAYDKKMRRPEAPGEMRDSMKRDHAASSGYDGRDSATGY